jgi:late competence protein required for DNA uptake (superfamily II DNA/RNA helicase)
MENTPLNDGISSGPTYTAPEMKSSAESPESAFICNVCLEITNKDPVVTQCGHLYCWRKCILLLSNNYISVMISFQY